MKLHEVSVKLTKSQILKILHDEPLTIKHEHIGHGKHILHLKKASLSKLLNHDKIHLDSNEREKTIEGNGFGHFLKKVGRTLKHTFSPQHIESALIHQGIPTATSALGSMLGGPAGGFAGAVAGHEIADIVGEKTGKGMKIVNRRSYKGTPEMREKMKRLRELRKKQRMAVEGEISDKMLDRQATTLHHRELDRLRGEKGRTANLFGELRTKNPIKEGQGLFRTLHKMGIHRKDVVHAGKVMGKAAAEHGIDTMANIAGAYGFPVPPAITESLKQSTDHLIDGNHKRAMESIKAPAKEIMKEQIQKQVDKLPIEVQPFVESKVVSMGLGLKKKHQRVVKGGTVRITRRPKILYKNLFSGSGLSDDTFSSIASIHAPQMHPYVPQINSFVRAVPLNGHGLYQPSGHGLF